jgi:predicted TPR repeat methyltransferase
MTTSTSNTSVLSEINELSLARQWHSAYERALSLTEQEPQSAEAWDALAMTQIKLNKPQEAEYSIKQALQIAPHQASYHVTHALLQDATASAQEKPDFSKSLESLNQAVALDPKHAHAYYLRGSVHAKNKNTEQARADYERAVALDPEHARARFKLALLGGIDQPAAAPADYVRNLFDGYAERFESHLTEKLGYRAPQALADLFSVHAPSQPLAILDLGCGTGLAGPLFRPYAQHLDGIDLSDNMLAQATKKGVYDRLTQSEILAYLHNPPQVYDLAIAADVLCYFGDLSPLFATLTQHLSKQGQFLFSIEAGTGNDFQLMPCGRYQHTLGYIANLCSQYGWTVHAQATEMLRTENHQPVAGQIFLLQKFNTDPTPNQAPTP